MVQTALEIGELGDHSRRKRYYVVLYTPYRRYYNNGRIRIGAGQVSKLVNKLLQL